MARTVDALMIDIHTHLWPASGTPQELLRYFEKRNMRDKLSRYFSADGLLDHMERNGVSVSLVSAIALSRGMKNADLDQFNGYVQREVAGSGGRLAGLCTVDPLGGHDSVRRLRACIEDRGFVGLKLHPCIQEFYPNDERVFPLYEAMQAYGLPVLFHTGGLGIVPYRDRFGQPLHLDDVACVFPELPILMGHAGRIWYSETAMLLRKHPNLYADISTNFGRGSEARSEPLARLLGIVRDWTGSLERLLFGSDYPFYTQRETLDALGELESGDSGRTHLEGVKSEELHSIPGDNTRRFCDRYGLSFETGPGS